MKTGGTENSSRKSLVSEKHPQSIRSGVVNAPGPDTLYRDRAQRVRNAVTLLFLVVVIGTLGYVTLEGWPVLDALFMTIITLSTVGYSTVYPLTETGKILTVLLIIAGVGAAAYTFAAISQVVIEGELRAITGFRAMQKRIASLRNHTIVCGYGRLARIVVSQLNASHHDVVVIESNPEVARGVAAAGIPCIEGSADDDEILLSAGIQRAKTLLALLPKDADNVYVILSARDLNGQVHIIARCEDDAAENKLRRAGANSITAPYSLTGGRIAQQLLRPHVSDFLEIAQSPDGQQLALEEVVIPENCALCGKTLEDSQLRARTGSMIAALIDRSGQMTVNPGGDAIIEPGGTMIVLGAPTSLTRLTELLYGDGGSRTD